MEENKQETPAAEQPAEKPATETQENAKSGEVEGNVEAQPEQADIMAENAKLKAFRNNAVLKQNGFKEEYNSGIQTIAESDGQSFDDEVGITTYLKDKKFDVFKSHSFNDTKNVIEEKENKESQGKKKETPKDIESTYIFVPGLDKK